tara:strand:- start:645 stop:1055 length:411 start_codon:yes stop_codon:yes gene_type:complete
MKKNELKKILKPLIKECIKEVIFEEGTLSTIITEVVRGTSSSQPIVEVKNVENNEKRLLARQEKSKAKRKKMLDAIGRDAYNGVDLFEGTTPAPAPSQGTRGRGALSDVNPNDPGVDISSIFSPESSQIWKKLSGK